ncbi:hypothetical protein [Cesiribacter sp. SM1]|uniref:hypothetical protein n=1 Tax=Cesiribacter sp. SM1 TaxID=2861196 RepID=UPI001CD41CC7|nr:hypothetical protein [Cesiribacter sp. SM1]
MHTRKYILLIISIFTWLVVHGQNDISSISSETYRWKERIYGPAGIYFVLSEITLNSDSTFITTNYTTYRLDDYRNEGGYKDWENESFSGVWQKSGDHYVMIEKTIDNEYRNDTPKHFILKPNTIRIIYMVDPLYEKKWRKGVKYKKIK